MNLNESGTTTYFCGIDWAHEEPSETIIMVGNETMWLDDFLKGETNEVHDIIWDSGIAMLDDRKVL